MKQNCMSIFWLNNMSKEIPHQFKDGKKRTLHEKGTVPGPAMKKRRGPTDVSYIDDYHKRKQTLSTRLPSLWKKAKEFAIMTGVALKLLVRNEYYDSVESGHAKEEHFQKNLNKDIDVVEVQPTAPVTQTQPVTPNAPVTEVKTKPAADNAVASTSWQDDASQNEALDDPAFSPRKCLQKQPAVVARGPISAKSRPSTTVADKSRSLTVDGTESRPTYKEKGIQCEILSGIPDAGVEMQCRMCGAEWENDSRTRRLLWLGCDHRGCKYWVHADCLLGKSSKLTPEFLENMPFKCHKHR